MLSFFNLLLVSEWVTDYYFYYGKCFHINFYLTFGFANFSFTLTQSTLLLFAHEPPQTTAADRIIVMSTTTMKHFMMSKMQTAAAIIFTSLAFQETEIEIFHSHLSSYCRFAQQLLCMHIKWVHQKPKNQQ